jgi:hypothetical protein
MVSLVCRYTESSQNGHSTHVHMEGTIHPTIYLAWSRIESCCHVGYCMHQEIPLNWTEYLKEED